MGIKELFLIVFVVSAVSAQTYRVCVTETVPNNVCTSISRDDSQAQCVNTKSSVDCALKLANNEADIAYFSEEETLLLSQQQPESHRVIATVREADKLDPFAFESVAVVPVNHTGGFEGLSGAAYCHPGFDQSEVRWSPRVLRTLELLSARTDRCPNLETAGKTAEELEVETLNTFFSGACRPGSWSTNATVDADLKSRFPNLCSLCGPTPSCSGYTLDMGLAVAGVNNNNRHIQALECLRTAVVSSVERSAVAYVAWQHVREYFTLRNPQDTSSFALLCNDNTLVPLTNVNLANATSPCALVRQPWGTIIAAPSVADALLTNLRTWWPQGTNPGSTWQGAMFTALANTASSNARVFFEDTPVLPLNYTQSIRPFNNENAVGTCLPSRRWCVLSSDELLKCEWVRTASYVLGLQPAISCQLRTNVFECLTDIRDDRADFIASPATYGYLARQHYRLTPVKLVQNTAADAYRVAAFIKESDAVSENITRFENLRGKNACFPEFGGLAYMAFVRAGQEIGVLSPSECDYARLVGEFFEGACAPGAIDAQHALSDSSTFDASTLCSRCRSTVQIVDGNANDSLVCSWDYASNLFFGNNGSLRCLNDPGNDVAFLNLRGVSQLGVLQADLTALGIQANNFRALCRNNSLAALPGVQVDDACLLAHVVDAEVLTRRNDPLFNSLNTLFDTIDAYFGYNAATASQLINLEIFSPFNGKKDLLFKDSTIGLTEPTLASTHQAARNYIELFSHLQACTGSGNSLATKSFSSIIALIVMAVMTRFVIA